MSTSGRRQRSSNPELSCIYYDACTYIMLYVFFLFCMQDLLKVYKETRNGMLGPDYSTKFSPWLAFGCISPRFIYEEVKPFSNVTKHVAVFTYVVVEKCFQVQKYEKERVANNSTYWYVFYS